MFDSLDLSFSRLPSILKENTQPIHQEEPFLTDREYHFLLKERKKFKVNMKSMSQNPYSFTSQPSHKPSNILPHSTLLHQKSLLRNTQNRTERNISNVSSQVSTKKLQRSYQPYTYTGKSRVVLVIYDSDLSEQTKFSRVKWSICPLPQTDLESQQWLHKARSALQVRSMKDYVFDYQGQPVHDLINFWEDYLFISKNFHFTGESAVSSNIYQEFKDLVDEQIKIVRQINKDKPNQTARDLVQCKQLQKVKMCVNKLENQSVHQAQTYLQDVCGSEHLSTFNDLESQYNKDLKKKQENSKLRASQLMTGLIKSQYQYEDKDHLPPGLKLPEAKKKYTDFVKKNHEQFQIISQLARSVKQVIKQENNKHQALFMKNIPKMLIGSQFSRSELYHFFILFKCLSVCSALATKNHKTGIDFQTYYTGIAEIFARGEHNAKITFKHLDEYCQGALNQRQFMNLMFTLRNKTIENKAEMFFRTINHKKSLSRKEIEDICRMSLGLFIKDEKVLTLTYQFFTDYIYKQVGVDFDKSIQVDLLKDQILRDDEEVQKILSLFFGI